jgi:hypothetical protein
MNINKTFNSNRNLPTNLNDELLRLSSKIEDALADLEQRAQEWAINESAYRQAKATNFLRHQTDSNGNKHTIPKIEAIVDKECEKQRFDAYLSRAMKESALEKVRSLRTQLSALQTISNALKAEIELAGRNNL